MSDSPVLEDLLGVWALETFRFADTEAGGGEVVHPLGAAPTGSVFVSRTASGVWLALTFMARGRQPIPSDDILGGSDADMAGAFRGYVSFAGPCRMEADTVVVSVVHALLPNWVGSEQRRRMMLEGDCLTLATLRPLVLQGRPRWGQAELVRAA